MKITITHLLAMSLALATFSTGCKTEEQIKGKNKVTLLCSSKDYPSNGDFLRETAMGVSKKMEVARDIARANARTRLAQSIETKLSAVTEGFLQEEGVEYNSETKESYQRLAQGATEQTLAGSTVVCEEIVEEELGEIKLDNGLTRMAVEYTCYIAMELQGGQVIDKYISSLSAQQKEELRADRDDFRETFKEALGRQ